MTKKKARWWLESLVRNYGGSVHKEALSVIFTGQGESRPTVRPKRAVQQRKGKTVRNCGSCGRVPNNCFVRCSNHDKWIPRTASPVA